MEYHQRVRGKETSPVEKPSAMKLLGDEALERQLNRLEEVALHRGPQLKSFCMGEDIDLDVPIE